MHPIDRSLLKASLTLPQRTKPAGNYAPATLAGNLLFISGQFPVAEGVLRYKGQIGRDLSEAEGWQAARLAALNVLAHLRWETENWRRFEKIVRVDGYVSSAAGWHQQPKVLDGASDLFAEILGAQAGHARTAVPCSQLPVDAAVELAVIASLKARH